MIQGVETINDCIILFLAQSGSFLGLLVKMNFGLNSS